MKESVSTSRSQSDIGDTTGAATRVRLMDAAERLVARDGLRSVSTRAITTAARANLAAINYHFGTKEGLISAMLERRISWLNAERAALLDAAEAVAEGEPVPVEALVEAMVRPLLRADSDAGHQYIQVAKMISRFILESEEVMRSLVLPHFGPLRLRFHALLRRALPQFSEAEIKWRADLAIGVVHNHLVFSDLLERLPTRDKPLLRGEAEVRTLVAFCAAGIRSGVSTESYLLCAQSSRPSMPRYIQA